MALSAQTVDKTKPGWYATEYNENRGAYWKRVFEFYIQNKDMMEFPPPDEEATWTVYLLSRSMFEHYMLGFARNDKLFIIHLTHEENEPQVKHKFKVWLSISVITSPEFKKKWKELNLGDIKKSLYQIFDKAFDVMVELGPYTIFENNCQKYVKILAKELGVPGEVKTGSGAVMSGSSKISDIAQQVWKYPVNLTDTSQKRPQYISQDVPKYKPQVSKKLSSKL